ncbi:MAG: hypothetical protein JW384_04077 [Nitrosomonadaceae bacterium]|nr:hypothetical protein [Nitrosomonadaceae bacterium]
MVSNAVLLIAPPRPPVLEVMRSLLATTAGCHVEAVLDSPASNQFDVLVMVAKVSTSGAGVEASGDVAAPGVFAVPLNIGVTRN